ncbi:MAG: hypothetical protein F4Z31_02320 [Gemmatimonadetes bacterium]|nr:hypothetical protein [Gemmatimonadota bacterium]
MSLPTSEPPTTGQPWHSRSVGRYFVVGVGIVVVGSLLVWGIRSIVSDDEDPTEVDVAEGAEVNVDEPSEVIIKEPTEVIIEQPAAQTSAPPPETTSAPTAGDCDRFPVYAQGRWTQIGTAVRSEPTRAAPQTDSIQPNVIISVDGWVRSDAPYPTNDPPWNEDVWFRLTDRSGWVSFAGVRASPSHLGGTDGPAEGGWPVELKPECEIPSLTKG